MTHAISGTNSSETINGTSGSDTIFAKAGNDIINAGNGNDDVDAGSGNDTVNAGSGNDEVDGGSGNDIINGESGNDELRGGGGNDTIDGGSGDDLIDGGDGDDVLKGNVGCDVILGGDGNDTITAGGGNDLIYGGQGTDTAIFAGSYASYDIFNLFGLVFINGQDGTDLAFDVEFLKFDNGTYNVATHTFTPNQPTTVVSVAATDGVGTETLDGNDFTYTFTRTGDLSQALTVNYSIVPAAVNGATPGADFPAQTGTVTFAAGSSTAVLQFSATDDAIIEGTEAFSVALGAGAGYQVNAASASANGTIIDNDFPPAVVSLTPATVTTTEGGTLTFTFTRTGGNLAAPLTISYIVNDGPPLGGATRADGDFNYPSGLQTLTFAAGQTVATITVQSNHDAKFEDNESFPVLLAGGVNYTVDPVNNGSTGVIQNDDVAPVVSLTPATVTGEEGTALTFTFTRTGGDISQALTINYVVNDGGPLGGATRADGDFSYPSGMQQLTFAAGQTVATITVQSNEDSAIEGDESFAVLLAGGLDYTMDMANSGSTGVILNDDPALSIADTSANEEVGTISFTVTLSATATTNVTFSYSTADGSAGAADYVPVLNGSGTILAGQTSTTITIALTNDAIVETGGETFLVNLSNPVGATIVDGQASGLIVEQDLLIDGTPNPDGAPPPGSPLNGGVADDTINGLGGNDVIDGLAGNDQIFGGNGDDALIGNLGNDLLNGGAGFDRAIYTTATLAVNIQLAAGNATLGTAVDTLQSIEFARGTAQSDTFNAAGFGTGSTNASSEGNNFNGFEGLGGNDQIFGNGNTRIEYNSSTSGVTVTFNSLTPGGGGGGTASGSGVGTDTFSGVSQVRGSQGNDLIINFGATNNTFDGQGGFDTVSYAGLAGPQGIIANLQTGNVFVPNLSGPPPLWNDSLRDNLNNVTIEAVIGTAFNDVFIGNTSANSFDGLAGTDIAQFVDARTLGTWTDNGSGGVSITTPNGGTDSLTNVELMQFSDAFQLTSAGQNADLTGITAFPAPTVFGNGWDETITIGGSLNGHEIALDGGSDTVLLGLPGTPSYNLGLLDVEFLTGRDDATENVFLFRSAVGMTVNLGVGFDQLSLGSNGNTVTAISVETIVGSMGDDGVTFVLNDNTLNQEINLNGGSDVLTLGGTSNSYSLTLQGIEQVKGHAGIVDDDLNVLNLQLQTEFDLGAGNADELHLNSQPTFPGGPNGINVVTVYNTENVFGAGAAGDQIHIGGNAGGVTTVTAGLGSDLVWASIDADNFRFITTGDSSYDLTSIGSQPAGGQRDIIDGFDAMEDAFVFDHIAGATGLAWELVNFGGANIVLVDLNGGGTLDANQDTIAGDYAGWEMAIQVNNLMGNLSNDNFSLLMA